MKKILGAAVLMAAGAAMAATTIESSNTFGFVPVTGATGLKAVAVPVVGYGTDDDIKIAEVLQTANLDAGDKLYTMTADGKYNEYVLQIDKTWKASRVVTVSSSGMTETSGTLADEATLKRGQAFWLDTAATQVNILGQAPTGVASISPSTGWQMIGNPSMTTPLKISKISGSKGAYLSVGATSYLYLDGTTLKGWYNAYTQEAVSDTDVIAVGQGAMYKKD